MYIIHNHDTTEKIDETSNDTREVQRTFQPSTRIFW